jgi:nitroimidazol reductase NimA-like FMN-containing flavoprotein (pyridoxamine 5'-phosphate oxidase superfamily)
MAVIEGRTWLEVLAPRACAELLAGHQLGRVAFLVDDHPEILPVNYALDGDRIVFRTDRGLKLHAIVDAPGVAFEIDDGDPAAHTGWSVLVVGRAEQVTDAVDLDRLRKLPLQPWAFGEKPYWVRIVPRSISGRSIRLSTPR